MALGVKNQLFKKKFDFSLPVSQKTSVESSINNEAHQKGMFNGGTG